MRPFYEYNNDLPDEIVIDKKKTNFSQSKKNNPMMGTYHDYKMGIENPMMRNGINPMGMNPMFGNPMMGNPTIGINPMMNNPMMGKTIQENQSKTIIQKNSLKLKFDDFKIMNHIKNGAFADVFSAKHPTTGDFLYAIKTIRLRAKESDQDIKNELEILEEIHSLEYKPKSIPKYFGFHKEINKFSQTQYNIIMEYLPNNIKTNDPFPFKQIKSNFETLINGLSFLQTMNICHRDLKPSNLLLDEQLNNVYMVDFGVSKQLKGSNPDETKKLLDMAGSPNYLSPELYTIYKKQATENITINPYKSDVFSLGLIILKLGNLKLPNKNEKIDIWEKNI